LEAALDSVRSARWRSPGKRIRFATKNTGGSDVEEVRAGRVRSYALVGTRIRRRAEAQDWASHHSKWPVFGYRRAAGTRLPLLPGAERSKARGIQRRRRRLGHRR